MNETGMRQAARAIGLGMATILLSAFLASLLLLGILEAPGWANGVGVDPDGMILTMFMAMVVISTPFVALGLILFGLPVDYVLRRIEIGNPLAYAACGMLGGLILSAIIVQDSSWLLGNFGLIGMGYGMVTSLVFWTLFRRWRPAEDEA